MRIITQIQKIIEADTPYGPFRDALYYESEPTAEQLAADAQSRIDAHIERMANPPEPPVLTPEAVVADAARIRTDFEGLVPKLEAFPDVEALNPLRVQVTAVVTALNSADGQIAQAQESPSE